MMMLGLARRALAVRESRCGMQLSHRAERAVRVQTRCCQPWTRYIDKDMKFNHTT